MPKFVVQMVDIHTGEILETTEEVFGDRDTAEEFARGCAKALGSIWAARSVCGRRHIPGEDVAFVVEEV